MSSDAPTGLLLPRPLAAANSWARQAPVLAILLVLLVVLAGAQEPRPTGEGTLGGDIVEIYDSAVAHLEKICDDYRRIKGIQLARMRDLPFEEAYENISSVMPILAEIDRELLRRSIRDPRDIQGHKVEVELVKKEIEMMIDLTAKLLKEIEVVRAQMAGQQELRELTLEDIVQQPEYDPEAEPEVEEMHETDPEYQELVKLAKEDQKQKAKDLTPVMREFYPDIKDLTQQMDSEERRKMDLFKSSNDTGRLARILDPDVNKAFGRKIREGGMPTEWLFVDAWYTIGPFPNPQRKNIHRKFPPETVIDLDAKYVGKDGKEVRWQFVQSHEPMVTPADPSEYAIYYAYTEVHCDRPMDLWVAVGSDDKANVWLNSMPIWISSDRLKGWSINEGFRKVAFKQGVNRFFYRVENGWLNIGFSLGIRVAP